MGNNPAELNPQERLEIEHSWTLRELTEERIPWRQYRERHERSAGLDASLNTAWEYRQERMDKLLEKFKGCLDSLVIFEPGAENEQIAA